MNSLILSIRRSFSTKGAVRDGYTELIIPDLKDKVVIFVGREDSPSGFHKLIASRPHMESISTRWSLIVLQKHSACMTFHNAKPCKKIILANDDIVAIRIVLNIAHLQYHRLPLELDFNDLIHLAEAAERYDLNTILRPFLKPWLEPYRGRLLDSGYEQWLYLAWQFGLEEEFLNLAHHLAKHCAINEAGQLVSPSSSRVIENGIPREVLHTILMSRQQLLRDILGATYDLVFSMPCSSTCLTPDVSPRERYACTAKNLLGLQRYLKLRGLGSPLPSIDTIHMSPNEVIDILTHPSLRSSMMRPVLESLQELDNPFSEGPVDRHSKCMVEDHLAVRVSKVVQGQRWSVSLDMFNQLRRNAGQAPLDGTNTEYQNNRFIS